MIRKLLVIFTLLLIVAYFILLGLFGEGGVLRARSLQQELEILKQKHELLSLQVQSLELQKQRMSSQDALKDAAFRYGYQQEGEQVFYFTNDDDTTLIKQGEVSLSSRQKQPFKGVPKVWILFMALVISLLSTVVWYVVSRRRERY